MTDKKIRFLRIHYAAIESVYWVINAIFMVFIVPLLRERGFDNGQIGILLAVRSFSCIALQPMVASFADKYEEVIPLKYIISGIVTVSLITSVLFYEIHFGFWASVLVFIFLGASITALTPLYTSLAMQYLAAGYDLKFSIARGCGSIAYALCCVFLGYMVDSIGVEITLVLQIVMLVFSLIIVLLFRTCPVSGKTQRKDKNTSSTWEVFINNKGYSFFLIASILLFIGNNMTTSFLVDVVDKLGGTNKDVGYCQFVLAAAEFPIALLFIRLKKRMGTLNIMRICAVFTFIRIAGIRLSFNIPLLIGVHAFQMLGIGLYWSGSVYYVNENVKPEDKIKGQSLMTIFSTGIGSGAGSLISGWIISGYNIDVLVMTGTVCAAAGVAVMFYAMKKSKITRANYAVLQMN